MIIQITNNKHMTEPSDQTPDNKEDLFKAQTPQPGKFLKAVDKETDVDPSEVEDASDGMGNDDFLGKTNLINRDKDSEEDR